MILQSLQSRAKAVWPILSHAGIQRKANTCSRRYARENQCEEGTVFDWLTTWRESDVRFLENHVGCFPLCQRFRKFRLEFKWKGPFRFLPTGIFGITSGGGPLISVGIFRSKFAVPFLTNRFFALIREFGNDQK